GINSLINATPVKPPDDHTLHPALRYPYALLMHFTSAAMNYSTVSELDKAYKYIAQKLSDDDELLAKATDVYSVRREELNETSM
ncbi:recombinase RecT, partial [Escherichia coli]|nr:recombinase RecT [Escherichia coli]